MRVAIFKGQSQYGVLRLMIDEAAAAFKRRGFDVVLADLAGMDGLAVGELGQLLSAEGPLDLVFSINIGGYFADATGRPLMEIAGAPHVVQYVDYPFHDRRRLLATSPATALLFVDPSHVRTVEKLLGPGRFAFIGFNPHAALGRPVALPEKAADFAASRPIPVLFAGSCYGRNDEVWSAYPQHLRKVFLTAVDIATSVEWISPSDALDHALALHGLDPNNPQDTGLRSEDLLNVRFLAAQVQEWVRRERRQLFLAAAARAGLKLTVVGNGYDGALQQYPNLDWRGPVAVGEAVRLMGEARLVVSLNGNFGQGTHERPFTAMLAGAAVASDFSAFYAGHFRAGRDMALFRWTNLNADLKELAALSENPAALLEMARAGQEKVLAGHLWDHRLDAVLVAAEAVRRKCFAPNAAQSGKQPQAAPAA